MKCHRCQHDAPPDPEFCPRFGSKLALARSAYWTSSAADDRFRKKCGRSLPTSAAPVNLRQAAPRSYTPFFQRLDFRFRHQFPVDDLRRRSNQMCDAPAAYGGGVLPYHQSARRDSSARKSIRISSTVGRPTYHHPL